RLGEVYFPNLVPGLLRTHKTDASGPSRLGMERREVLLPDIIANAQSPLSTVKEGFMSLLVFLPATFGTRFQPHLPKIIAPILGGLSDQEEFIREAAMCAGGMVATNYSSNAIRLAVFLCTPDYAGYAPTPPLQQSSITLVGDLLFKVSGTSGKKEIEETRVAKHTTAAKAFDTLQEHLGGRAINQTIPTLLEALRQPGKSSGTALQALKEVVSVRRITKTRGGAHMASSPCTGSGVYGSPFSFLPSLRPR
ncbi:hypothetical protein CONPUDRAFT_66380, partial [Coniophora puteana RWD-64-598 SS2]